MPAAAWMTIAVAGLIIVFTAVGLVRIVLHLYAIRRTLAAVTGGAAALIAAGAVTGHVTMIVVGSLLLLATGNACVQALRARRRTGSAGEAATPPP